MHMLQSYQRDEEKMQTDRQTDGFSALYSRYTGEIIHYNIQLYTIKKDL